MSGQSLAEFLRRQRDHDERSAGSRQWHRTEWLEDLTELGERLERWLESPIREGLLQFTADSVPIHEPQIGRYDAPRWAIRAGPREVVVHPVGRFVVGAQGRVDMENGPVRVMLVRTGRRQWSLVGPDPAAPAVELEEDSFTRALEQLLS